jgi:predicted DNA-binding transcriptional regulator AlpA
MSKKNSTQAIVPETIPALPGFVHEKDLARQLNLKTYKSMWRYRRQGTGPTPTIIGRQVYYADADIAAWLQRCRQPQAGRRRRRGTAIVPQREQQRRSA